MFIIYNEIYYRNFNSKSFEKKNQILVKNIQFRDKNQSVTLKSDFDTKKKTHFKSKVCFRHKNMSLTRKFDFASN